MNRNISNSKASEATYRGLLEAAPDAMVVVNKAGEIVLLNIQAEKQFGYSRDELVGTNVKKIIPEGFAERLIADALRSTEEALAQEIGTGIELTGQRKNGSNFPIEIMLSPLESPVGILVTAAIRNISVRKETNETLEKLAGIVDSSDDAILSKSLDGIIQSWNMGAERLYGYSKQEAVGRSVTILARPGGEDEIRDIMVKIAKGEPVEHYETERTRKDGQQICVSLTISPIRDATGRVVGASSIARNITERKRVEGKLRDSETRYRRLFEAAHDGILILDADSGEITDVNPFLTELLGFSHAELLGKKLWEIGTWRDVFLSKIEFDELQSKGYVRYEHLPLQTRAGRHIDVEFVSNVYFAGDRNVIQCNIRDITERARAEAERLRLTTAIEQAAEGVLVTDKQGEIHYVNPAFSAMTGYSREEVLGKNPRILKSGKQDAAFYASMWATILAGQVWRGEMINRRKDGSLYTETMSITPVHNEHGEITQIVAMKEDITARRLLEDQFRQAQKMEAVGRLAAGVAHDFNNLLTVIVGYCDIMLARFFPADPMRAYTTEIKGAGERAAGLTRQLLAFSRQQILAPQVLDLNTLVSNVSKMLHRLIGEDIELVFKAGPCRATVKADPGLIEQVLMNLAVNSRDAMPQGGKLTIETSSVQVDDAYSAGRFSLLAGPYVMLAVCDNGCGMDKDIQAHIFEPFFTTKETGRGTGLGLATVYGIVKQSGGSIWVYSEVGLGTTFKIYLPAITGAPETAKESAVAVGGSETVLLVEDDASLRELTRTILVDRGGYNVLASTAGKEARLLAEQYKGTIHLLLTDVVMPGISGRVLSEELVILRPGTKILYMSGYTDDTVVRHGVLDEGIAFLQKPFTSDSLLRKVRDVLDTQAAVLKI